MSSLSSSTWSYQLQFNFKFKKSRTPFLFTNARIPRLNYHQGHYNHDHIKIKCVAKDETNTSISNNESRDSWNLNSSIDWFGDLDSSNDSGKKNGIGGLVGVGVAGVLLFAGITSASLPIGKRFSSRSMPEMKPIIEHLEVLSISEEKIQDEINVQTDYNPENKPGYECDLSSSLGPTEYVSETTLVDDTDIKSVSVNEKSTTVDLLVSETNIPETISSPNFSQVEGEGGSHKTSGSVDSQSSIKVSKSEDYLDFGKDIVEDGAGKLGQQETLKVTQSDSSYTVLESFSSVNVPSVALEKVTSVASKEDDELPKPLQFSSESDITLVDEKMDESNDKGGRSIFELETPRSFSMVSRGIPAPSVLPSALEVGPGKVLVPAIADQTQSQAWTALKVLKVVESDAQPGDLCTRREYARWLVSATSALSRNLISKVYPAMYIENITELAFDDITPEDPDFTSIQGLAEAGLISSKLSKRDMLSSPYEDIASFYFHPDSPLSRQDLVTWKIALERRQLPEAHRKALHQISGFIDIDRIDPDAYPALVADLSAAEQGIVALAFGYTRLFQPDKPVTKGQAAIALTTGEAIDVVSEELARIEAESIADKAVSTHNTLVAEVEREINASFEKELLMEREKIDLVQKMAEETREEAEKLRVEREEQRIALMKERAAIESEMEVLSRVRNELEEQLQIVMSNKVEISYEKERIEKVRKETEEENQAIIRLQYELEVERKALSMARVWAEEEAKRVQEHARELEEARDRWEKKGLKVIIGEDLLEETSADTTWTTVGKKLSVQETSERAETLLDKLKLMAGKVTGKSKEIINAIIQKIQPLILAIKEWISKAGKQTTEFKDASVEKVGGFGITVKEGAKRVVGDCREGVEKLTQRFKT